jgi:hypothetical protein
LMPAPRHQDHTTSPYASGDTSLAPSASTASHRAFVTFASAPHPLQDGRSYAVDLGKNESGIFLICRIDMTSEYPK